MSPEDWRRTYCGKVQFDTWDLADRVRRERGKNCEERRQVYRCMYCRKWHLGRPGPGRKPKRHPKHNRD